MDDREKYGEANLEGPKQALGPILDIREGETEVGRDVSPCCPVKFNRHFEGKRLLHLQGGADSKAGSMTTAVRTENPTYE
jgi:hypothetical protein